MDAATARRQVSSAVFLAICMIGLDGTVLLDNLDAQGSDDCVLCTDCGSEDDPGNAAWLDDAGVRRSELGPHGRCYRTGDCDAQHPRGCGPQEDQEQLASNWKAVVDAVRSGRELLAFAIAGQREDDNGIYYSAERNAIQARVCGPVVFHIPLARSWTTAGMYLPRFDVTRGNLHGDVGRW